MSEQDGAPSHTPLVQTGLFRLLVAGKILEGRSET